MKILVTPRSFGKNNPELFSQLEAKNCTVIRNDTGAILSEEGMIERLGDCTGLIVGVDPLNAKVLAKAPKLRAIAKYGVGLDNIDLAECERRHIAVSRTVGANSQAVADYTLTLMLTVARKALLIDRRCRKKDWSKITSLDLYGKTLGIIGLGAVGKNVALRSRGFAMKILVNDVNLDQDFCQSHGLLASDLDTICREADFLSLHAALTPDNHKMISKERLGLMKKTAILINTARGDLVDEEALLEALVSGSIFGAGLDVFTKEPPEDPRWYELENVVLGSHCASSTLGATATMGQMAVDHLLRDLGLA